MLDFEKDVVQLFDAHQIDFEFESKEHLLISETLTIIFIPICSIRDYIVPDNLPESTIKTIRIWQDEYMQHKEIIDSRILSLIGISQRVHARQTRVKAIDKLALKHFLIRNHLNVPTSARHRYGLFRQQELVAVAAFGRHCPVQDQGITYRSHELIRYCSLLNTTVVGGLSKLIHHFEKEKSPEHLMTYVDREWSDGRSYQNLGFKKVAITPPQRYWLAKDANERLLEKNLSKSQRQEKEESEGWRLMTNLGNLKLVKYLK